MGSSQIKVLGVFCSLLFIFTENSSYLVSPFFTRFAIVSVLLIEHL